MTDFAALLQPDRGQPARTLHLLAADAFEPWLATQPQAVRSALQAAGFTAQPGEVAVAPFPDDWSVVVGASEPGDPWALAAAAARVEPGNWRIAAGAGPGEAALGWLLAQHRFDRYRAEPKPFSPRVLLTAEPARIDALVALARAVARVRDLVDTGAEDMGPAELEAEAAALAKAHGAALAVTRGEALAGDYPMIHAVGRAATEARAPRLIELEWGDPAHPHVAIVGKGVAFDTGGLDIKSASGMRLMKKDMGGAAHALALAGLVMEARLPVRLHLLVPAVENAIAGPSFRPGDVLRSRKGPWIEIGNTDAEGRLILGDALARAVEAEPALILDFATLTGAARVALGPDLPALFANDDTLASALLAAGIATHDPLWRLPLHPGYREVLKSDVADYNNAPEGGLAGAVTAALFLEIFVPPSIPWAHLDTFAWRPAARPGRPKGGEALGLRAAFAMLRERFPPLS